jgi:type II secretory pathway component PulF
MAVYEYLASNGSTSSSALVRGTISADSPRSARDQLRSRGLSVRELTEQKPSKPSRFAGYLAGRQTGHVTGLLQEMATLLGAGIPLLEAMDTITRQHTGRFQQAILLLRDGVAAGGSLAEAMGRQPMLFDDLCINIVEVGENSGTLDTSLRRLVEFRRRSAGIKNKITSAMIYPCIVMTVGLAVSLFLMTYVVPNLLVVLIDSGKELPLVTQIVKAVSDVLLGWWWAIGLGIVAVFATITAILRTDRGLMAWHRLQLKLPLVGELTRKQAIARMSMVMSTLLKSDLVFTKAVQIAQRTVKNRVLRDALVACEKAVYAGQDIAAALETTKAFPPLVIQVFAVGQASGRLESMLEDLAIDYDTQVDIASSRLTAFLEPIMIILLAVVLGAVLFATILPIIEAGDVL